MYDDLPTVYFQIQALPARHWPARVRRRRDVTLVWIQPGTLMVQVVFWCRDFLFPAERLAVRLAFDAGDDLSVPVADRLVEGELTFDRIPFALRPRFALRSSA